MLGEAKGRSAPVEAPLPPLGPGCFADGATRELFVQDVVRHRGATGRFDDVVGRGFVLASPAGEPHLDPELAGWFASLGGMVVHVAPGAPVDDVNGGYARWFAQRGAELALARPDFGVFGTAAERDGANALVRALRTRLGG
jgi:3-(3-hydroxy-phenyl)propionate hydroxylase